MEKYSEIFLEKNKGLIIDLKKLKNYDLDEIRFNENIIIDNLDDELDETFFYSFS